MAKTVLITGGAMRLGKAMALSLAEEGWDIAIHCRDSVKQAESLAERLTKNGRSAYIVQAELGHVDAVAQIIPAFTERGVQIDALINNAAMFEKDTLTLFDQRRAGRHLQVNLLAPLQLIRDFAQQYKGTSGAIINILDGINGWSMSPQFLSYALSKSALQQATHMLAQELAPRIRINGIAPGPTLENLQDKKETFPKLAKRSPLKRLSSPQELCDCMQYLLHAPSVTGQVISLAGGL